MQHGNPGNLLTRMLCTRECCRISRYADGAVRLDLSQQRVSSDEPTLAAVRREAFGTSVNPSKASAVVGIPVCRLGSGIH